MLHFNYQIHSVDHFTYNFDLKCHSSFDRGREKYYLSCTTFSFGLGFKILLYLCESSKNKCRKHFDSSLDLIDFYFLQFVLTDLFFSLNFWRRIDFPLESPNYLKRFHDFWESIKHLFPTIQCWVTSDWWNWMYQLVAFKAII